MRILIAIDGSPFSDAALDEVAGRPWPKGSEIMIVSAYELPVAATPEVWAVPGAYYEQLESAITAHANSIINCAISKLRKALPSDITIKGKAVAGSPKRVILDEANNCNADLIVVGSHGYPAWERLLLGSVSQAVVSHAKCSVEVVRHTHPVALLN